MDEINNDPNNVDEEEAFSLLGVAVLAGVTTLMVVGAVEVGNRIGTAARNFRIAREERTRSLLETEDEDWD